MSRTEGTSAEAQWVLLRIEGRLAGEEARAAKEQVRRELRAGLDVIVDLSEVPFMDSDGLGAVVVAQKTACVEGRRLILCGLRHNVQALLELTRLHRVFEILPDAASAQELIEDLP